MRTLALSALDVLVAVCAVIPPFLLGRALGPNRCKTCSRRNAMANRARLNGEHVARLRQRAVSPDAVRRQAQTDREERAHLVEVQALSDFPRDIAW